MSEYLARIVGALHAVEAEKTESLTAGISVTKSYAVTSIPTLEEIESY